MGTRIDYRYSIAIRGEVWAANRFSRPWEGRTDGNGLTPEYDIQYHCCAASSAALRFEHRQIINYWKQCQTEPARRINGSRRSTPSIELVWGRKDLRPAFPEMDQPRSKGYARDIIRASAARSGTTSLGTALSASGTQAGLTARIFMLWMFERHPTSLHGADETT